MTSRAKRPKKRFCASRSLKPLTVPPPRVAANCRLPNTGRSSKTRLSHKEFHPMTPKPQNISPAKGKLAVLTPGMGAVASTLYAGVEAVKRGLAKPIGSYTQMGQVRLGKRTENRYRK